jgi:hypothetical protein
MGSDGLKAIVPKPCGEINRADGQKKRCVQLLPVFNWGQKKKVNDQ